MNFPETFVFWQVRKFQVLEEEQIDVKLDRHWQYSECSEFFTAAELAYIDFDLSTNEKFEWTDLNGNNNANPALKSWYQKFSIHNQSITVQRYEY